MATGWPKSLDTIHGSAEDLCKRVGKITEGRFEIRCFAGGEIVRRCRFWTPCRTARSNAGHVLSANYHRQEPDLCLRCRIAVRRLNARQQAAWLYEGGGLPLIRDFYKKDNIIPFLRQRRHPDGRFLPQGDQHGAGSSGFEDPHRRSGRRHPAQARGRAAATAAIRHLFRAGTRHDRRIGMDRAVRRCQARPEQGGEVLLRAGLVGRQRRHYGARPASRHGRPCPSCSRSRSKPRPTSR